MGDYDYGIEHGMWGTDGIPYDMNEDEEIQVYDNRIIVHLTPRKYLNKHQTEKRREVDYDDYISGIQVIHDRYNKNDKYALEVFYKNVHIGYIRKKFDQRNIDNTDKINNFCFTNGIFNDIVLTYVESKLMLIQFPHKRDEKDKPLRERADNIMFKFKNVPQLETEALSIKHALGNADRYSLSQDDIGILKLRLAGIAAAEIGSAGKEMTQTTLVAIDSIIGETVGLFGKLIKFARS